jgi:hypothetical protein
MRPSDLRIKQVRVVVIYCFLAIRISVAMLGGNPSSIRAESTSFAPAALDTAAT